MDAIYVVILVVTFASVLAVAVAGVAAERKENGFRGR
jgi:hypothetical protein